MRPISEALVVAPVVPDARIHRVGDDVREGNGGAHVAAERGAEESAGFDRSCLQ